ncbi:MAG: hypothetical protein Q9165_004496 [Trypethelium subeluteriae]
MASQEESKFAIHEAARNGQDDDDRLPIHWAVSYNQIPIVEVLVQAKNLDPDDQVGYVLTFPRSRD